VPAERHDPPLASERYFEERRAQGQAAELALFRAGGYPFGPEDLTEARGEVGVRWPHARDIERWRAALRAADEETGRLAVALAERRGYDPGPAVRRDLPPGHFVRLERRRFLAEVREASERHEAATAAGLSYRDRYRLPPDHPLHIERPRSWRFIGTPAEIEVLDED
jgi:hypothetical protein